ncbi:Uncharacterised protein [Mycobacteroides abscessus subsp. bolletii]|uniref:Uncharacterized protein n=1 Tax=Mycobacteroides abscessus subsp. bolletii TaxID=319705 RepID=A0A9Q7SET6_9MYCO|nr:Uncharacterised protein [Mycobacteroides abscessus subsp. bolletii]SHU02389.1 Uncharacterised protein [Mycobacteroides abscessus subsp. bolletii]SHX42909.1 Uncharacterised protein [Mycobacteroides abscessus subsp. bolletii]SKM64859.1 Uncharacterised protein [Mycobacteroides abscessus subsp. bolletii]SKN39008.1 Uncharacterised protein [Mycobacteroides abscessus subsp. bolletii]
MAEVNSTLAAALARIARMPGLNGTEYAPGGLVSRSAYTLAAVPVLRDPWRDQIRIGGAPSWPDRSPAPWRIRCDDDGQWLIEKRQTVGYETWCGFDSSAEAFAAFAAGSAL